MIALENTCAVLLCGGQSRRFGEADKLMQILYGKPLVAHAAEMLAALPFMQRVATVRDGATALGALLERAGFDVLILPKEADQAASAQTAINVALTTDAKAVLLSLGDMPFVTADHLCALAVAASQDQPALSRAYDWLGPPWIASAHWLGQYGHSLKRALRSSATLVEAPPSELSDIDAPSDLLGAEAQLANRRS